MTVVEDWQNKCKSMVLVRQNLNEPVIKKEEEEPKEGPKEDKKRCSKCGHERDLIYEDGKTKCKYCGYVHDYKKKVIVMNMKNGLGLYALIVVIGLVKNKDE